MVDRSRYARVASPCGHPQVRKVDPSSDHMHADRRLSLLCTMDGEILSVDLPESGLFGWPAGVLVGSNLADCIDVFSEWRDKAGAHQTELLLLSLLDREAEMPGAWVALHWQKPGAAQPEHLGWSCHCPAAPCPSEFSGILASLGLFPHPTVVSLASTHSCPPLPPSSPRHLVARQGAQPR